MRGGLVVVDRLSRDSQGTLLVNLAKFDTDDVAGMQTFDDKERILKQTSIWNIKLLSIVIILCKTFNILCLNEPVNSSLKYSLSPLRREHGAKKMCWEICSYYPCLPVFLCHCHLCKLLVFKEVILCKTSWSNKMLNKISTLGFIILLSNVAPVCRH